MSELISKKQKLLIEYLVAERDLFIQCVKILDPNYFDSPLDRVVAFVKDHFFEYSNLPDVDIIEAETDIELKVREVDQSEYSYVTDEIERFCQEKAMKHAILESVDLIETEQITAIQELVKNALMVKLDNSLGTNYFEDPKTRILAMDQNIDERSFGVTKLDQLIGNIRRGELGAFYAVTSGGKSVMLSNVCRWLTKQKLHGVVVSLELGEDLYSKRLDAIYTNTNIKHHKENVDEITTELTKLEKTNGSLVVKRMKSGTTVNDIRTYLMEYNLMNGFYPDFVIVDYLANMGVDGLKTIVGQNKFDIDEAKAIGLRDIAEDHQLYMFTAGQINRDGYDVINIKPSHCAGGISVLNTCDWAIGMVATDEDLDNNQVQAIQLKMRNGTKTSKHVTLYMNPQSLRFNDSPWTVTKSSIVSSSKTSNPPSGQSSTGASLSKAARARAMMKGKGGQASP